MIDQPILMVAGQGRCGTTMMMSMLDHGGFPVTGQAPAYELDEMCPRRQMDYRWLANQTGHAVKWLSPLVVRLSRVALPVPLVIIAMERDEREQGASQT